MKCLNVLCNSLVQKPKKYCSDKCRQRVEASLEIDRIETLMDKKDKLIELLAMADLLEINHNKARSKETGKRITIVLERFDDTFKKELADFFNIQLGKADARIEAMLK